MKRKHTPDDQSSGKGAGGSSIHSEDKEYVMDIARSIVRDANLDGCSEHEIDPLGDFGLHDMMSVRCASKEASIKRLKERIGSEADALKKFKESSWTFGQEIKLIAPVTPAAEPTPKDIEMS
nr:hypothetical protein CFP56_48901 [Quercus suber]